MLASSDKLPTNEQRRQLCELMHYAFVELRYLSGEQTHDLADAFHNLPLEIFGWGTWSAASTRAMLLHYQRKYSQSLVIDYVVRFDSIFAQEAQADIVAD